MLVIGIMLFWNAIYDVLPLYNTMGIMVLAYVVLYVPYTVQYVTSAFNQINDSLIQAGRTFGGYAPVCVPPGHPAYDWPGHSGRRHDDLHYCLPGAGHRQLDRPSQRAVVSTYINREFEQGSVSLGMAMAVLCVLITTGALLLMNGFAERKKGAK